MLREQLLVVLMAGIVRICSNYLGRESLALVILLRGEEDIG